MHNMDPYMYMKCEIAASFVYIIQNSIIWESSENEICFGL